MLHIIRQSGVVTGIFYVTADRKALQHTQAAARRRLAMQRYTRLSTERCSSAMHRRDTAACATVTSATRCGNRIDQANDSVTATTSTTGV